MGEERICVWWVWILSLELVVCVCVLTCTEFLWDDSWYIGNWYNGNEKLSGSVLLNMCCLNGIKET